METKKQEEAILMFKFLVEGFLPTSTIHRKINQVKAKEIKEHVRTKSKGKGEEGQEKVNQSVTGNIGNGRRLIKWFSSAKS